MLYVRCAFCGYMGPLLCGGQFMPHPPMPASLTPMGATCPACGPMPPAFRCACGYAQYLYIPGVSPMPQAGATYAPVVQAQPGASDQSLGQAFAKAMGTALGEGASDAVFGQFQ